MHILQESSFYPDEGPEQTLFRACAERLVGVFLVRLLPHAPHDDVSGSSSAKK